MGVSLRAYAKHRGVSDTPELAVDSGACGGTNVLGGAGGG